ncbi:MAG: helix-hairpin-helix domain-containing protein [Rikenellaceae bacterium]|nr:helix-hairpin-helix domain-containing protein [Rikenellaceae bacterium]
MGNLFNKREIAGAIIFLMVALIVILLARMAEQREDPRAAEAVEILEAEAVVERADTTHHLRPFDPNTVDYETLRALGMSRQEAVSLLKFRASGKIFRIAEDVALCYGISDSAYRVLAPYINIGEEFRIKPRVYYEFKPRERKRDTVVYLTPSPFLIDTVTAAYLQAIGAFTRRQAEAFLRWRDRSGFYDMEEVRRCYVVDDSVATALERYILFPERPTEEPEEEFVGINSADSATLVGIYGIGPYTAHNILIYRARLGGFVRVEQLREVKGLLEKNYAKILPQIYCDSCEIKKIDINFATPSELLVHPYLGPKLVRQIIKHRRLKGGWTCIEELVNEHILTEEEAERLRPYALFVPQADKTE